MKSSALLRNACWVLLLVTAVAFIVYGCAPAYEREEWMAVLSKATSICFQCIGLG